MPYPTYHRPSTPAPKPRPYVAPAAEKQSRASLRTIVVVLVSIAATGVSFWRIRDVMQRDRPQPSPYEEFSTKYPEFFGLIMAIRNRDPERAKQFVQKDPWLVNFTRPEVMGTALHFAAITDQADLVQFLIDHGADISSKGRFGGTPLHWAAWRGSAAAVRTLLDNGADADVRSDEDRSTPLFWLARAMREPFGFRGDPVATARALLDAGASAETSNKDGFTASDVAGVEAPIYSLLLSRGARPSTTEPALPSLGPWGPPRDGYRGGMGFGGYRRRMEERERERAAATEPSATQAAQQGNQAAP